VTDVQVTTTETTVLVVDPASATVNVTSGRDTILIDGPDFAYCGAYDNDGPQSAASSSSTYLIRVNQTDVAHLISNNNGVFTFERSGTYLVTFSIQWDNSSNQIVETNVFLKKNNQILPNTSSYTSVTSSHGGINGKTIMAAQFVLRFIANDTLAFYWQSNDSAAIIETVAATTTPEMPLSPGIIVTIGQIA